MLLTHTQRDRAGGVLLGQAIGDALGVPYEFAPLIPAGQAAMIGGGLGPYAPGEWSDDTQMALCIAEVLAATGSVEEAALAQIAENFLAWQAGGATDIGNQTRTVLSRARASADHLAGMQQASREGAAHDRAGNGALMRTAVVGLIALDDARATADAAAQIAALTHAHPLCVESSILWSEAVRVAVTSGRLDLRGGLALLDAPARAAWAERIDQAETQPPAAFTPNGFTVTALQAAWASIHATRHHPESEHAEAALQVAVSIGDDTDTVAAIAGGLLGARYGVSGLPSDLVQRVHGWPRLRAGELIDLAVTIADHG